MRKIFSRRMAIGVCLLVLLLFLARPRVGRLRGTVAQAISQGVGRRAEISSIHLRLFPRLGFELDDLIVHDDPQFGAEPLLRAPEVTAWLRVGALLRGRIEIASLSLGAASLNLTRNDAGRWNIEDLVERTSHTALAPTSTVTKQAGASFPYIEATHARVNFKVGIEKTHFALSNAEFALWQDSQDTWGARLKAAPIRTDKNLTDTGVINLSGTWSRSAGARQTPLQLSFQWKQAQIGQLSRLLYGADKEWRGGVLISGNASGTPENLQLALDGSVEDFRHRDVIGEGDLPLAVHCSAQLDLPIRAISNLDCVAPAGSGFLEVKGSASGPRTEYAPFSTYDLWLIASKIPADDVFQLACHANVAFKKEIAAKGEIGGSIEISRQNASQPLYLHGGGAVSALQLHSQSSGGGISVGTLPFNLVSAVRMNARTMPYTRKELSRTNGRIPLGQSLLLLGPVDLVLGKPVPLHVMATISAHDYSATVKGEAGVERLLETAHVLGIPAPAPSANGAASVDLSIAAPWMTRPTVLGTAQLHSVKAQIHGINAPLEIATAHLALLSDSVRVQNLAVSIAGTTWRGSLIIPHPCAAADCGFEFNLHAPTVTAAGLNALLNPSLAKTPWYKFFPFDSAVPSYLLGMHARGNIAIDQLILGKTTLSDFAGSLKLNAGEVSLSNFHGVVLDGRATGDWSANFSHAIPSISGSGKFEGITLAQVAQLMHNGWMEGTGTAKYSFSAAGRNWQDLFGAAKLSADFDLSRSTFPHIVLVGTSEPLRTTEFLGNLRLANGEFSFREATLKTQSSTYTVTGTATLNGVLAVRIASESAGGFNIAGTLTKTVVSSIPTAQAALKP